MNGFIELKSPQYELQIITTGTKTGRSLLIDDGALPWIVQNANNEASPIRRHIELALCHLAQHGELRFCLIYMSKILSIL